MIDTAGFIGKAPLFWCYLRERPRLRAGPFSQLVPIQAEVGAGPGGVAGDSEGFCDAGDSSGTAA